MQRDKRELEYQALTIEAEDFQALGGALNEEAGRGWRVLHLEYQEAEGGGYYAWVIFERRYWEERTYRSGD